MNKKIIIGVVIVVIAAVIAGIFLLGSSDLTLYAGDTYITVPGNYTLDDKGIAYGGDVGFYFSAVAGANTSEYKMISDTLKSKGSDAGY